MAEMVMPGRRHPVLVGNPLRRELLALCPLDLHPLFPGTLHRNRRRAAALLAAAALAPATMKSAVARGDAARRAPAPPVAAPCADAVYHEFDFFAGDWDTYDVGDTVHVTARNRVTPMVGGCALREVYEQTDGLVGESFSTYDAVRRVWHQSWVTNRGSLLLMDGRLENGRMVLTGADRPVNGAASIVRVIWTPVAPAVRETCERSTDGGRTWAPVFDILFRPHRAPDTAAVKLRPSPPVEKPLDATERQQVIEALAQGLTADYVFPEIGARYAVMLRTNLARGTYDMLTDPDAFSAKVTSDLQRVSPDGHLRIAPKDAFDRPRPRPAAGPASTQPSGPPGLEEAKMIGNVAYLRFNLFPDDPTVAQKARRFLLDNASAAAVILDARPNRGGDLTVMNAVLPLLYARRTTQLRMDTRAAVASMVPENDPTLVRQPSPATVVRRDHVITPDPQETRLYHVPVYYLTSRRTASAAEHLAFALKLSHRATLIGDTTAGVNHYGIPLPLGERFLAFMPVGRSYDPGTGQDWEGKGVPPDVPVPADQALAEALRAAVAAGAHPDD